MLNIFKKFNIEYFAFVSSDILRPANERLFCSVPSPAQVIFMLFPYYCGDANGKISAYGAVHDYHSFARTVFCELEEYVKKSYEGVFVRGFTDHSPFLECEGASMAGLGLLGDNSLLITEKYSSYVFIGELVTTLSKEQLKNEGIPEGTGKIKECLHCSACERACPSGCLQRGCADLCVSAISQKKGELNPEEIRLLLECDSIWGCDRCQWVCPFTVNAKRNGSIYTPIDFFKSSYIEGDPCEIIKNMDNDTFSLYPFAWRKRRTIERNIDIIENK